MRAAVLILLFLAAPVPAAAADWRDVAEQLGRDAALADACGFTAAERDDLALATALRLAASTPRDRLAAAQRLVTEHHVAAAAIHAGTPPDCAAKLPPVRRAIEALRPQFEAIRAQR